MKHKAFFIFMTALLIGSPLYAQKYKIALIHSYHEGYSGAGIVNKLFGKGLKDLRPRHGSRDGQTSVLRQNSLMQCDGARHIIPF